MKIYFSFLLCLTGALHISGQLSPLLVAKSKANIYERPDSSARVVSQIKEGELLTNTDTSAHLSYYLYPKSFWVPVIYNNKSGFLISGSVENATRLYFDGKEADRKISGQHFYGLWVIRQGYIIKKIKARVKLKKFKTELTREGCYIQRTVTARKEKIPPLFIIASNLPLASNNHSYFYGNVQVNQLLPAQEMAQARSVIDGYAGRSQNSFDVLWRGDLDMDDKPDLILYNCADFGCLSFLLLTQTAQKGNTFVLADINFEPNRD